MSNVSQDAQPQVKPSRSRPSVGRLLLMSILLTAGLFFLGWAVVRALAPRPAKPAPPDLAQEARDYLRERQVVPLSGKLSALLAGPKTFLVKSQEHQLLGQTAPDFDLLDVHNQHQQLEELLGKGPVVLVFYYGYYCNHCVSQLFEVHADVAHFREAGAQVVAISADPPELTRKRFQTYGEFAFPVLSDPGNLVAEHYGVARLAKDGNGQVLSHATFIIDREGIVRWVNLGDEPFTGNRTLLYEVARLEGKLPAAK